MADDPQPTSIRPERSLDALESFLRVIRIPREDVRAMITQVGPQVEALLEPAHGRGSGPDAIPKSTDPPRPIGRAPDPTSGFEGLPGAVRALYDLGGSPRASVIGEGREALVHEALANLRDGRFASTVALVITQIDGVAADVPPTPGAAFPFVVADPRDRAAPDELLPAAVVAAHPGASTAVATLMRTARPDSGPTDAVHRHGIMHGRDLGFGTHDHAVQALAVLDALVSWAEPVVRARVAAGRTTG